MKTNTEFEEYFQSHIYKATLILEEKRIKEKGKLKNLLIIAIAFIPLFILGIFSGHALIIFLCALPFFLLVSYLYKRYVKLVRYLVHNYKKYVLQRAVGFYFDDFEYIAKQKIAKVVLDKSRLFPEYIESIYGEDFMRFYMNKVELMFCETDVYGIKDKKLFRGVFITNSFNKFFNSETFVIARKSATFLQRIRKQLFSQMDEVQLENPEFTQKFQTISNDQVEARYILTPVMMEHLLDYSKKLGKSISISFVKNKMYCSIPISIDLFEPSVFKPIDLDFVKESIAPVLLFTDIVKDLDLNLRIWSKR